MPQITWGDWNSDTASSSNVDIQGDTFTLASAIPDSVIDHFEAVLYEDKNNALSDYYSGDLSIYTRQTSTVYEQNYALQLDIPDDRNAYDIISFSGDGLKYPQQGDTFSYWYRTNASEGAWAHDLIFGAQDSNNFYVIRNNRGSSMVHLVRIENGNYNDFAQTSYTASTSDWEEAEVDWGADGTITLTIYDQSGNQQVTLSGTDTTWSSGGFGWRGSGGVNITSYVDNLRFK